MTSHVTALAAFFRPATESGGSSVVTPITSILVALIAAGLLSYVRDAIKAIRHRRYAASPEGIASANVAAADGSLLVVVKARDELEADNARLRLELTETRARYTEDRNHWGAEKAEMRGEIDALSAKLRALLAEVEDLRTRHA